MAYGVYVRNPTWVDGSGGGTSIDAADLNANDLGVFNSFYQPCVRVTHNAAQSITNATETTLAFNTERFDQAGNAADTMHDTVTNNSRLTCRYAGVYQITANIGWSASAGFPKLYLRLNGTTYIGQVGSEVGDLRYMFVTTLYALAVNDYVEVRVYQNSGGAINVANSANWSPEFMMVRVG